MSFVKFSEAKRGEVPRGDKLAMLASNEDMFAVWAFMPKGLVKDFQHHIPVQFYYIIKGKMELTIGDETQILEAGDSAIVPSDAPHKAVMLEDTEDIEVFNDPRKDVIEKWFS